MGSGQRKCAAELDYLLVEVSIVKESSRNGEDVGTAHKTHKLLLDSRALDLSAHSVLLKA